MTFCRFELRLHDVLRAFLLMGFVGLAGCAGSGPAKKALTSEQEPSVTDRERPRLELVDEYGFTVTEVVRIDSDVRADYQEAIVLLHQDRLEEGVRLLESVVEQAPDVTAPHIDLGVAYGRLGDHEKAEQRLRAALALAPDHPVALNELGIVYRRTGKFDAARTSYQRALDIHPGYHFALLNLGVLCDLYLDDLECALQQYESYSRIVTDDEQVGIWIADLRNRLGVQQEETP